MKYWTTQNHEKIAYRDLEDTHLKNIMSWIERKAEEGLEEMYGGGMDAEDIWFDSETIYGDEVKEKYDYKGLLKEAQKRGLKGKDCQNYGHLPRQYEPAFWDCSVCEKELEFYTTEDIKRIKNAE